MGAMQTCLSVKSGA
jgi:hypothetical protein